MLIIGLYDPLSFQYEEGDVIDPIIARSDTFLDIQPNGVVLCGGNLNRLHLNCLSTSSGLVPMVNFAIGRTSILGDCLTNHPELFNDPYAFKH